MNLFDVYPRFNINLIKGRGVYVYDHKKTKYLDLYGGHGVISIGHSHPNYVKKMKAQIERIGFYSNSIEMPLQEKLASRLGKQSGYNDHNLFLCNSGAEANENAIKLASFHTNKKKLVAFKGSFHGRTAATLNVTDNLNLSAPINRNNFPVALIDLNNENQLIEALKNKDICAVIVEGIQGVGGLDAPTPKYLEFIAKACREHDALLILDEIQSGYGRSGKFFAHQYANIEVDIITIAKGMGNGFPIGGVLIHSKIEAKPGLLGTTFGGNHLACAAGLAVLKTIEHENLIENVQHINKFLINKFSKIAAIKQVKGKGLIIGIEFDFPIKELRTKLLQNHHIFTGAAANPNLLRILPPLGITAEEIQPFINALKEELS